MADPSCGLQAEDKLFSVDGTRANSFRGLKPLIAEKTQITLRVLREPVVAEVVQGVCVCLCVWCVFVCVVRVRGWGLGFGWYPGQLL